MPRGSRCSVAAQTCDVSVFALRILCRRTRVVLRRGDDFRHARGA